MFDIKDLCKFLVKAKKITYASGDESKKNIEKDHSTTIGYEEGDWEYHDNYFGGEPYGGREVVFFQGNPVYIMTYYGRVDGSIQNPGAIYKILQEALRLIPESSPYRGPEEYSNGECKYRNSYEGEVDNFFGEEVIEQDGKEVYKAKYMGGLVDQRK